MLDAALLRIIGIVCLLVGCIAGSLWYGHTRYKEGVRVTRLEWDSDRAQWQAALDKQKQAAAQIMIDAQAKVAAVDRNNQMLHDQQEKDYAEHQKETDAIRAEFAARGLRFAIQAAKARPGPGRSDSVPASAPAADAPARTVVQLPDALAGNLRRLTADADDLKDAYRRCVQAVSGGPSL